MSVNRKKRGNLGASPAPFPFREKAQGSGFAGLRFASDLPAGQVASGPLQSDGFAYLAVQRTAKINAKPLRAKGLYFSLLDTRAAPS
jgi:hypothetical protein